MKPDLSRGKYWTKSISPCTGCTPYSDPLDPCRNCWSRAMVRLRPAVDGYAGFIPKFHPDRAPLLAKSRNKVVFASIMGDWCHDRISIGERRAMLYWMGCAKSSVFLTCTKRTGALIGMATFGREWTQNVWAGATAWDPPSLYRALDALDFHGAPTWVSFEPLLDYIPTPESADLKLLQQLDWVVVGPETGSGRRPCQTDRIRGVIEICKSAGVPCWVKAVDLGSRVSHDPQEWPADLRVRDLPPELERILRP